MSDSDGAGPLPSAATIEQALRSTVVALHKAGKVDEITVKRVRTAAEQELALPAEFFKTGSWKSKSNGIIRTQAEQCDAENPATSPAPEPSPPKKKSKAAPNKSKPVADPPRGAKRKSPAAKPKPQKRRKVVSSDESEARESVALTSSDSNEDAGPTKPLRRANVKVKRVDSDEEMSDASSVGNGNKRRSDHGSDEEEAKVSPVKSKIAASKAKKDLSESDLSDVFDEPPKKKPRQKSTTSDKPKKAASVSKPSVAKAKVAAKDLSPQEAEIKQLQSHLVSCGVKKVWSRYLAQYETPKAKINHLKELLRDVGMDGRYTLEKAQKIKAKRELDAELDAVQEGEKHWGNSFEDGGRPQRRAAARATKPIAPITFGSDDSEAENEVAGKDAGSDDSEDHVEESQGDDDDDDDEESEESDYSSGSD